MADSDIHLPPLDEASLTEKGRLLLQAARKGSAKAIRDIGCQHIHADEGFPRNPAQARKWYHIAADMGEPEAQYDLGSMHLDGEGGNIDIDEALRLLSLSARNKSGDPASASAADLLSKIFEDGLFGVEKNAAKAAEWRR